MFETHLGDLVRERKLRAKYTKWWRQHHTYTHACMQYVQFDLCCLLAKIEPLLLFGMFHIVPLMCQWNIEYRVQVKMLHIRFAIIIRTFWNQAQMVNAYSSCWRVGKHHFSPIFLFVSTFYCSTQKSGIVLWHTRKYKHTHILYTPMVPIYGSVSLRVPHIQDVNVYTIYA